VVDSSSDGFMKSLLKNSLSADNRLKSISIHDPDKRKSLALNFGARRATGRLLIFTDNDVLVSPQWIRATMKAWSKPNPFYRPSHRPNFHITTGESIVSFSVSFSRSSVSVSSGTR
jgi:hypothetical protein